MEGGWGGGWRGGWGGVEGGVGGVWRGGGGGPNDDPFLSLVLDILCIYICAS